MVQDDTSAARPHDQAGPGNTHPRRPLPNNDANYLVALRQKKGTRMSAIPRPDG